MTDLLREDLNTVLFIAALLGVLVYAVVRDRRNPLKWSKNAPDPMDAMIERRGFDLERHGARPGYGRAAGARMIITDHADPDAWELIITSEIRKYTKRPEDETGDTVFRAPAPVFAHELAVFAAPVPGTTPTPFDPLRDAPGLEEKRLRRELRDVLGDSHGDRPDLLVRFPAPARSDILVLATRDPAAQFDVPAIAQQLARWTAFHPTTRPPRLVIDAFGMMLFVPQPVFDPGQISMFVTMGQELAKAAGADHPQTVGG